MFPALRDRLPTNEEVLKFHEIRRRWVTHLRGADAKSRSAEKNVVVQELGEQLKAFEYKWAPPPHMRADMDRTPIPAYFFEEAAGELATWDLRRVHQKDLVPQEQADLMQDVPSIPLLKRIASCEARACISLCRPEGRYVNRRKLKGRRAPIVATQPFHAGEFSLRSLTEDVARGFVTGVVASTEHLKQTFQLKERSGSAYCWAPRLACLHPLALRVLHISRPCR